MKKIYKFLNKYGGITESEAKQFFKNAELKYKKDKKLGLTNELTNLFDYKGKIYEKK